MKRTVTVVALGLAGALMACDDQQETSDLPLMVTQLSCMADSKESCTNISVDGLAGIYCDEGKEISACPVEGILATCKADHPPDEHNVVTIHKLVRVYDAAALEGNEQRCAELNGTWELLVPPPPPPETAPETPAGT